MDIQLKRGMLDACVLSVLLRGESYGYLIVKDIGSCVEISESTLYPILRRMEAGGFVTVRSAEHNGRLRKYYSITEAGRGKIKEFLEDWEEIQKIFSFVKEESIKGEKEANE